MAENCSDLYPWMPRPYAFLSEATFARENDALTRALQLSLLAGSSSSSALSLDSLSPATSSLLFPPAANPFPRRCDPPAGRIGKKRKYRPSKSTPTTYITADPANFRHLVQRVTGIQSGDAAALEVATPPAAALQAGSFLLPTLDTSAPLLDRSGPVGPSGCVPVLAELDPLLLLPSFPTLDPWGAQEYVADV